MEQATTTRSRRRTPDTAVNGVILSPKRAELLTHAIRARLVTSEAGLRAFLAGLEREQRAEDKQDPQVAEARRLMWHNSAPKARPGAMSPPRSTKTDADRRREVFQAEQDQFRLEANVWRPAGAGRARIRHWNLDPARMAALMGAIADTNKLRERLNIA